jgi:hypothetical protein
MRTVSHNSQDLSEYMDEAAQLALEEKYMQELEVKRQHVRCCSKGSKTTMRCWDHKLMLFMSKNINVNNRDAGLDDEEQASYDLSQVRIYVNPLGQC